MKLLQTLPTVPMRRFGVTPYDEPLFRVVFSDSRTDLVGGRWPDGRCEYREVPRYPDIHGWVLEKWLSPEQYAGTREKYEREQLDLTSGLYTCGPYPQRGEYAFCYAFPCPPGDAMVVNAVTAVRLSRDVTDSQRRNAIMDGYEKQEKAADARFSDVWDESMGPWQKADAVVSFANNWGRQGFKRASDMDVIVSNKPLPLPRADNYFGTSLSPVGDLTHARS